MIDRWRRSALCAAFCGLVVALAFAAAGCSGDGTPSTHIDGLGSTIREVERLARREGELDLVALPDYAQPSWAELFAQQTGCAVKFAEAESSKDVTRLLEAGSWDGVSAPGDVAARLMRDRDAAPVDPALLPNLRHVVAGLRHAASDSLDGQPYGAPVGRTATLLVYRSDLIAGPVESWATLWEAPRSYAGHVSLEDDALTIADAALYLKRARPVLRIDDPYELDQRQFDAAVALIHRTVPKVGLYWTRDTEEQVASYASDETVVGTALPRVAKEIGKRNVTIGAVKPVEGATGRSDTWMVSSSAENPNCMYLWMDFMLSPEVQASVADLLEIAPANLTACELTDDPGLCERLHADDEDWWRDVELRTSPSEDCGDDREEVCVPAEDWEAAWARVTARR